MALSIAMTGSVRMRCCLCRATFWRARTHPCPCCSARQLPCRLDLRRRWRQRPLLYLFLRRRRSVPVSLRRRLCRRRHVVRSQTGGRRKCDGVALRSILFIEGRVGMSAILSQPSIGTFLLFLRLQGRGLRVCRRLATLPLVLRWTRRTGYQVCRRRNRVAARAGKVAQFSRSMVHTRASALIWSWSALESVPKLGRRSSSSPRLLLFFFVSAVGSRFRVRHVLRRFRL